MVAVGFIASVAFIIFFVAPDLYGKLAAKMVKAYREEMK